MLKLLEKIKRQGRRILSVDEALQVIKSYRIPVVEGKLVKTAEEAVEFANSFGYPVVLKLVSKNVTHKTDIGCVFLNLRSEVELRNAFRQIIINAKKAKAKIDGMLVQRMVGGGQCVIVGGKKDMQFGQTIAFGLGGIFVEVFDDMSFRVVPINKKDAESMIKEIKGYKILSGFRGKAYDVNALINILLKASKLLEENQNIAELDINPVIALRKGALAVDARIIID